MKRKQFLAWVLAGTLTLGMNPYAVSAEEGFYELEMAEETEESVPVYDEEPVAIEDEMIMDEPQENESEVEDSFEIEGGVSDEIVETPESTDTTDTTNNETAAIIYPDPGNPLLTAPEEEVFPITIRTESGVDTSCTTIKDLAEKLETLGGKVEVVLAKDLEMTQSITVGAGMELTVTAGADIRLTRDLTFVEDFFVVDGGTLQISGSLTETGSETSITLSGTGTQTTGSLIHVKSGSIEIGSGASLTGNDTTAPGSAIYAEGGSVILEGCESQLNTSTDPAGGGIYVAEAAQVYIASGDGMTAVTTVGDGIVMENGTIWISGDITGSRISAYFLNPSDKMAVLTPEEGTTLTEEMISGFTFDLDAEKLSLDETSGCYIYSETVAPAEPVIRFDSVSWNYWDIINGEITFEGSKPGDMIYVTVMKQETPLPASVPAGNYTSQEVVENDQVIELKGSEIKFSDYGLDFDPVKLVAYLEKPDGTVKSASIDMDQSLRPPYIDPKNGSVKRISEDEAVITMNVRFFSNQKIGRFYLACYDEKQKSPIEVPLKEANLIGEYGAGEVKITVPGLTGKGDQYLCLRIQDKENEGKSRPIQFHAKPFAAPTGTPTPTPTDVPVSPTVMPSETPSVTPTVTPTTRVNINPSLESDVKVAFTEGSSLELKKGVAHKFTITGDGTDNTNPIDGDTRWIYLGWAMSANATSLNSNQQLSVSADINDTKEYTMYVFFRQEVYSNNGWQSTGVEKSKAVPFTSKKFSVTPTGTITGTPGGSSGYDSDSGNSSYYGIDTDGDGKVDTYATSKDVDEDGNVITSAGANTADNSPIGLMVLLMGLSAAAALILARRRQNA